MDDRTPESGDSRLDQLQRLTVRMSDSMRTDIVLYHGAITQRRLEGHFIGLCRALASAPNVLLVIATSASSADAAQWMGRFLRESYEKVTVYADNSRGSTGALLALGTDELIIIDAETRAALDPSAMARGPTAEEEEFLNSIRPLLHSLDDRFPSMYLKEMLEVLSDVSRKDPES